MLKDTFLDLINNYTNHKEVANEFWNEIEVNYSKKKRYYHTLVHLENLLIQLQDVKLQIKDWNTILFTLFYHDAIYNSLKKDNEEKSAELAAERMKSISVPIDTIQKCKLQILATKSHLNTQDTDTNYFTDADLSVLGADWNTYTTYYKNVRKEYSIYPDIIYNPGRKKVLEHFLAMERIYKTEHFYLKFEEQAKWNLNEECRLLSE